VQVRQLALLLGRHAPRSPLLVQLAAAAGITVESVSHLGALPMALLQKHSKSQLVTVSDDAGCAMSSLASALSASRSELGSSQRFQAQAQKCVEQSAGARACQRMTQQHIKSVP